MNRYTIEHGGQRFVVEAEDEASALSAVQGQPIAAPLTQQGVRTGTSAVTGQTPAQAQERGEAGGAALRSQGREALADAARYGTPIAAGLATVPVTGGMSMLGALGATSAIGSASAAAGELGAQFLEQESRPSDVLVAAALGATPFLDRGGAGRRIAVAAPSAAAMSEFARFIEQGDSYTAPKDVVDAAKRWAAPMAISGGMALGGAIGGRVKEARQAADTISKSRSGGSVLLSEISAAKKLESAQLRSGNKLALEAYSNMDRPLGGEVMKLFPDIPETGEIAAKLRENVGLLSKVQGEWREATAKAQKAEQAAMEMRATNPEQAKKLSIQAKQDAFQAVQRKALYEDGILRTFGGDLPELGAVAQGRRIASLREMAESAKVAVRESVDGLYMQAGIGINDPVASIADIRSALDAIPGDVARAEVRGAIDGFLKRNPAAIMAPDTPMNQIDRLLAGGAAEGTQGALLKLDGYRALQQQLASDLVAEGRDVKYANRVAASAYQSVREASDGFMQVARSETFETWKRAQAAAAANFKARQSDAVEMLSNGDVEGLYGKIRDQGAGPILDEVLAYSSVIANSANGGTPEAIARAAQAAQLFKNNFNKSVRDAAIDRSTNRTLGFDKDLRAIDPEALAGELQSLSSKGYPIQELGLGSPERIKSLARVASAGKKGGLTVKELDMFLDEAATLGADRAALKVAFFREVRDSLIERGGKRQAEANGRVLAAARRAKFDEATMKQAYQAAESDPLVRLLNDTDMKLSNDVVDNTKWVGRLLTVEPTQSRNFMDALEKSGRGAEAEKIRKAAAASVMRGFAKTADDGTVRLNLKGINDLFSGTSAKDSLTKDNLRNVIGEDQFRLLQKNFAAPIKQIIESRGIVGDLANVDPTVLASHVRGRFAGPAGVSAYTYLGQVMNYAGAKRYNTLYHLYLNPRTAPRFAAMGGNIEKYIATSPANAVALRIAQQDDDAIQEP